MRLKLARLGNGAPHGDRDPHNEFAEDSDEHSRASVPHCPGPYESGHPIVLGRIILSGRNFERELGLRGHGAKGHEVLAMYADKVPAATC